MSKDDATPVGKHLEAAARRGIQSAAASLEPPEFPDGLRLLWERFLLLDSQRRVEQYGLARLSLTDIDAANRMLQWDLMPYEVEALRELDLAILYPDAKD